MKPKEFDFDAGFPSMVKGFGGWEFEMSTGLPKTSFDIDGPQQPAMTPTEVKETTTKVETAGIHCSPSGDADPNWNGPDKRV